MIKDIYPSGACGASSGPVCGVRLPSREVVVSEVDVSVEVKEGESETRGVEDCSVVGIID